MYSSITPKLPPHSGNIGKSRVQFSVLQDDNGFMPQGKPHQYSTDHRILLDLNVQETCCIDFANRGQKVREVPTICRRFRKALERANTSKRTHFKQDENVD